MLFDIDSPLRQCEADWCLYLLEGERNDDSERRMRLSVSEAAASCASVPDMLKGLLARRHASSCNIPRNQSQHTIHCCMHLCQVSADTSSR